MRDSEFCTQVLKLKEGWSATDIEIDKPSNRIDITVAYGEAGKRTFFKRRQESNAITYPLRHLPIFGMRTFLNVPEPAEDNQFEAWAYDGSKLTKAMEDFAIAAIRSCKSIQGVSDVTGLTPSEVRELSERTGAALERPVAEPSAKAAEPTVEQTAVQSFDLMEMENIPVEDHPNWMRLIQGQLELHSSAIGLKMLLQRVRQEINSSPNSTTRMAGIRLLRQYFIKNQATHKEDIDILNGKATPVAAPSKPSLEVIQGGVPAEQHECWQRIISGKQDIETVHVGLQMMIERVRMSVENSPSESSRIAAARILRQFFNKHKDRLGSELKQLGIEQKVDKLDQTVTMPAVVTVPATNHECWQKLIAGTLTLETNSIGLQMMLERVRLSVQRNPTQSNRAAGIKILHQYFMKHQNRHREEILTLLGQVVSPSSPDGHVNIPPDNHPSWQRLINGELEIVTDVVALKMMLERIRISVEKNPSNATRLAGAKILRQYFIKHQQKHRAELNQLVAA